MKAKELRDLTSEELRTKCDSLGKELFDIRLRSTHRTVDKPHIFGQNKRDIARIKTILTERNETKT